VTVSRRELLRLAAGGCLLAAAGPLSPLSPPVARAYAMKRATDLSDREARWYDRLEGRGVQCRLCARECVVREGERGYCGVRENRGGTYRTLVHSRPCSIGVDPIEKKPFFHVRPGTTAFSLATAGCNINCKFCQNWQISQARPEKTANWFLPPDEAASLAVASGAASMAYTYSEPTVFAEYMVDCAEEGRRRGLLSLMISNGYARPGPLREIVRGLDAVKIDLKGFTEEYYRTVCRGSLAPVQETLKTLVAAKVWLEIVWLVVPTLSDDPKMLRDGAAWIAKELGPEVPVHYTRFHPEYQLKELPPTPVATLEKAVATARDAGLAYVYLGNVPGHRDESTRCPSCSTPLIDRSGYFIQANHLKSGACPKCGRKIPGIW
jgi:pyruvate formate lyase activating enzyme